MDAEGSLAVQYFTISDKREREKQVKVTRRFTLFLFFLLARLRLLEACAVADAAPGCVALLLPLLDAGMEEAARPWVLPAPGVGVVGGLWKLSAFCKPKRAQISAQRRKV